MQEIMGLAVAIDTMDLVVKIKSNLKGLMKGSMGRTQSITVYYF